MYRINFCNNSDKTGDVRLEVILTVWKYRIKSFQN